jgi:hypothetical protein
MKKTYVLLTLTLIVLSIKNINSQTIWNGPIITFSKENNADWTLEVNQDRITDNVWITRKSNQSLLNIAKETGSGSSSPLDTEWAYGTTSNLSNLTFDTFNKTHGSNPRSAINRDMVLHLITDDIYIDIKFTSFSGGGTGGGFAYERSSNQTLNTSRFLQDKEVRLSPNPSSNFINVYGLPDNNNYTIYNTLGSKISIGTIFNEEQIDIRNFKNGLYFLKFDNGNTIKFVKK